MLKDVDKATLRARRELSQEASFKRQVDDKKAATEAATKRQSAAVRKQMDLDAGQRKVRDGDACLEYLCSTFDQRETQERGTERGGGNDKAACLPRSHRC